MDRTEIDFSEILSDFEMAWQSGNRPALNEYLGRVSDDLRSSLLQRLLRVDVEHRQSVGEVVSADDYGDLLESLGVDPESCLASLIDLTTAMPAARHLDVTGDYSPHGPAKVDSEDFVVQPLANSSTSPADTRNQDDENKVVTRIGRYRIERALGVGGFGMVYLAHDEQLDRLVAIKVPHAKLISRPEDADAYLTEARTVANLDHPSIVPVHDVGSTVSCPCYVVSKYIEGSDLAAKLKESRLKYHEVVEVVATVADALHYAHRQGIVHRDIKPGNILISKEGRPFVVDFGLALREKELGKGPKYAGTPAYMSPEQARGEGHRVDGRSDVFSLGVVFYELMAGRKPFQAETQQELLEQVTNCDPKPLRQYDDKIPKELERICQTAMAKRATERYSTAKDFADDLRHFLLNEGASDRRLTPGGVDLMPATSTSASRQTGAKLALNGSSIRDTSDSQSIRVVPKGLRSFDAHDSDFFLELLPGPRDREGLPESLRFWKTRIEESDPDNTFSVGLIYGPSGCGKSSLVKAGLLPRLSEETIAVYIEATRDETESRLLRGLRKRCPDLEQNRSLTEALAALRRGQGLPVGKKVLIVLDQFEQWLHAKKEEENTELVQALRQCDGRRVQCILMVRDDFWMAVTRFLRDLEIRLFEGHNLAAVDLFPESHAKKVLAEFGKAFGTLPRYDSEFTKEHKDFLKQSVAGLVEEGKIICVRLALFAEMMKGKNWTPATLAEVGGTEGIGVTFLEESFSASTASPDHRYHQKAARAVLKDLLPDSGTDIKGYMRSYAELLEASGYGGRPNDFDDLIHILDREIRLITPTDPEGKEVEELSVSRTHTGQKYFQLTHDYLVNSLRDWLNRKQRESRKGRAELKLFDTSLTWNYKQENRYLPSLLDWINIRVLTNPKRWTEPQRKMMSRAGRVYGIRFTLLAVSLIVAVSIGTVVRNQIAQQQEITRVEGLVGRLVSTEPNQLPDVIEQLNARSDIATTYLAALLAQPATTLDEKRSQLHARLASVSRDRTLIEPLMEEMLTSKAAYVGPIRQQLRPYAEELTDRLWAVLRDPTANSERRFRAAIALADYVPESQVSLWSADDLTLVARQLVTANAESQPTLRETLRPLHQQILPELASIFADTKATDAQRLGAANAFADYATNDIEKLTELLTIATPEQYAVLFPIVSASPTPTTIADLGKIVAVQPEEDMDTLSRVPFGQRRANAAATLLRMGEREMIFPLFEMTDDPEALTQFIFRCRPRGVGVEALLDCFQLVCTAPMDRYPKHARFAILLGLAEFDLAEIPETRREALLTQLIAMYANDPSSGVHGAAGWLLRQWGQADAVAKIDQTPKPFSNDREWFTLAIEVKPTIDWQSNGVPRDTKKKKFFYTFVVFLAGEYKIGSLADEPGRSKIETRHEVQLTRPYAILNREITWEELVAFESRYAGFMNNSSGQPTDAGAGVDWYDAVGFCRWLGRHSGLSEAEQAYPDPKKLDEEDYPREPNPIANGAPRDWPLDLERPGFRLPTEAEWEIASRANSRTIYGFGSDEALLGQFSWFQGNSDRRAHTVRERRPSLRGLFDLHGNVAERVHDWHIDFTSSKAIDPLGPKEGWSRILRGGSWLKIAAACRSSLRDGFDPNSRSFDGGLRLAMSLPAEVVGSEPGKEDEGE